MGAGEIAAEPRRPLRDRRRASCTVGGSARSRTTLSSTSISAGVSATSAGALGCGTADHRRPEHPPGDDAEHGQQLGQPLGRAQPGRLGPAAGLQHLVTARSSSAARTSPASRPPRREVTGRSVAVSTGSAPPLRLGRPARAWMTVRRQRGSASACRSAGGPSSGRTAARARPRARCRPRRHLDLVHAGRRLRAIIGDHRALALARQPVHAGADQEVGPASSAAQNSS